MNTIVMLLLSMKKNSSPARIHRGMRVCVDGGSDVDVVGGVGVLIQTVQVHVWFSFKAN